MIRLGDLWRLLKQTALTWYAHNIFMLSAALAYYTVFSMAPVIIVALFVVGLFWQGRSARAQERIIDQMTELTGPNGAEMVGTMLDNAMQDTSGGILATVLGMLALLFGATAVFVQLKIALNTIWDVEESGTASVKTYLLNRLLSFGLVLGLGFLLLVSLLLSAVLAAAGDYLQNFAPGLKVFTRIANLVISFGVATVLFAMIYRYLPDLEIAWRDVWIGAAVTTLLFSLGKYGIGAYLGNSGATSTYGAAGSFVVLLLWVYYSSLIFFFGAVFTKVFAERYGTHADP